MSGPVSNAFDRMARIQAQTKRNPAMVSGLSGEPVLHLPCIKCTSLDPVQPEVAQRFELNSPYELVQTMTKETDVRAGDLFVVLRGRNANKQYNVRAVADWDWRTGTDEAFTVLVLEESKD